VLPFAQRSRAAKKPLITPQINPSRHNEQTSVNKPAIPQQARRGALFVFQRYFSFSRNFVSLPSDENVACQATSLFLYHPFHLLALLNQLIFRSLVPRDPDSLKLGMHPACTVSERLPSVISLQRAALHRV